MSFPLNVYAYALWLEEGRVEYLHYGLFQNPNDSIIDAQKRSTDLVLQALPTSPASILEIGSGLGTTLKLLIEKGYSVKSLTPDKAQIAYIKHQWELDDAPLICQKYEDFALNDSPFDAVLLQESAQYIDPLHLLNKTQEVLKDRGDLIIIDEFCLDTRDREEHNLHFLDDFLCLAERCGFVLQTHQDLSSEAMLTLDYLLRVIDKHRIQLIDDLSVTSQQLDQLNSSNLRYQENYQTGQYGYGLLHFKQSMRPKWSLNHFKPEYFSEFQSLFKRTFNNAMSVDLWQWKYSSEDAKELCIRDNRMLIGHYGGMPRNILLFGKPQKAIQIGDVIVSPDKRGALRKKGPFFLLAATFIEQYIGYGKPFLLAFGFPNLRAMKVAEYLGLYQSVGKMTRLSWPSLTTRPSFITTLRSIRYDSLQNFQTVIESLWSEMAFDLKSHIVGIRDYNYIQKRYAEHPEHRYQFLLIRNRFLNQYYGFVVVKINSQSCEIMDLITSCKNIPLLIFYVRRYAARSGYKNVVCHITENFSSYFVTQDMKSEDPDIYIANNRWTPGPSAEEITSHWWLMNGDTDYQ